MLNKAHERSLVNRFSGKPFALLGINLDPEKDAAARAAQRLKINWRTGWDGENGPVAKAYNIRKLPVHFIVLDAEGVVRYKLDAKRVDDLINAVEKLLSQ